MKNLLILIIIFCNGCITSNINNNTKCNKEYDKFSGQFVYTFVDQFPEYPGGFEAFNNFFLKNLKYPDQEYFQLSFLLEFIINDKGEIVAPRIKGKTPKQFTKAEIEVIRVLKMMPNWIPGKCFGKSVSVKMFIPMRISID